MFNIVFADILSFLTPGVLSELGAGNAEGVEITSSLLLIFAFVLEIPIIMIFLSRVLKRKTNRWLNIGAAIITILFVIGGGSLAYHYIFFATIEVVCLALIIWYAWKWNEIA